MEAGRFAAGSSRALRLDPFSLPVRFETADEAADERRRVVDLHRERVVVRRCVGGMRMALNLPVAAFRGVAIRLTGAINSPRPPSRWCLSTAIRRCRCRCFLPVRATTSWLNGNPGAGCWVCRSSLPNRTGPCASRSRGWAQSASKRRPGVAVVAARSRVGGLRYYCGAGLGCRPLRRRSIAANARSLLETDRQPVYDLRNAASMRRASAPRSVRQSEAYKSRPKIVDKVCPFDRWNCESATIRT